MSEFRFSERKRIERSSHYDEGQDHEEKPMTAEELREQEDAIKEGLGIGQHEKRAIALDRARGRRPRRLLDDPRFEGRIEAREVIYPKKSDPAIPEPQQQQAIEQFRSEIALIISEIHSHDDEIENIRRLLAGEIKREEFLSKREHTHGSDLATVEKSRHELQQMLQEETRAEADIKSFSEATISRLEGLLKHIDVIKDPKIKGFVKGKIKAILAVAKTYRDIATDRLRRPEDPRSQRDALLGRRSYDLVEDPFK